MFRKITVEQYIKRSGKKFEQTTLRLRSHVRIAVIDDEAFQPLDNLISEGFDVAYKGNIQRLDALMAYDIVLCDIGGVATDLNPSEQGAALIGEIKRLYPQKFVIVYSGLSGKAKALRLAKGRADEYIAKSAAIDIWLQTLDRAIHEVTNPEAVWRRTRQGLVSNNVPAIEIAAIEHEFVRALRKKNNQRLMKYSQNGDVNPLIQNIVGGLIASSIWRVLVGV